MKIAVGIIGLMLGMVMLLQSCTIAAGGGMLSNETLHQAGSVGMLVALLSAVAGAFAFGLPLVAVALFALAALLAFAVSGDFPDMRIWAFAMLILGVLAFFAWRAARKRRAHNSAVAPQLPAQEAARVQKRSFEEGDS